MGKRKSKYYKRIYVISFCLFFPILFLFSSCSDDNKIKEEKFIKIYTDLVIAKDTSKIKTAELKSIIFKKYEVSNTDYENTLKYYNEDPRRWDEFFKKTIDYVQKARDENP